ncbi:MAG: ABC transporter ATP-binding protein [Methylococcaceae bacterium]|jgi:putative ABC transport system ATP-binding protein
MIQFDHVCVTARDKLILSDINFTLNQGDKAVLCGKSGSGKSTLLKTLLGLYEVHSGSISCLGKPLTAASLHVIRSCAAYIGQEPMLGADEVRAALLLPFKFKAHRGRLPSEPEINQVLQRLQLPTSILKQACRHISGGEKQRIALARGLLLGKQLFLLDEVTSALDEECKQAVIQVFTDPQLTVLSISHDALWLEHSDLVYELKAGQLSQIKANEYTRY